MTLTERREFLIKLLVDARRAEAQTFTGIWAIEPGALEAYRAKITSCCTGIEAVLQKLTMEVGSG